MEVMTYILDSINNLIVYTYDNPTNFKSLIMAELVGIAVLCYDYYRD